MATADVVVIGGGCVGTSTLFHLADLGTTDTVLLEADVLGAGSTGRAAGGIRVQFEDELNTRLALRALAEFEHFEEVTGVDIDFKQVGYLFLLDNSDDLASLGRAAEFQRGLGLPTEVLAVDAISELVPPVQCADLIGATFCPREGYASPQAMVAGYAGAARRLGAKVHIGRRAVEILVDAHGVCGVRTDDETIISTRAVVIAAGVGSARLSHDLGFDLPVHGERRTIFYSSAALGVPDRAPLVLDFATRFYFHRQGPGLIFAGPPNDLDELSEPAVHRLPSIADASIVSSWSGDYEMSPDHNALIGTAPVDGLYYATGFSGHGFMQSPAVGEHLAELVLDRRPTLDLSSFSVDRFAAGRQRAESFVI